jgi:hypothetical protein
LRIRNRFVEVDATHPGKPGITAIGNQTTNRHTDFICGLMDEGCRVQADVKKRIRQMPPQLTDIPTPADIEKIEMRYFRKRFRKPVRIRAAEMNPERPVPTAPFHIDWKKQVFVILPGDHRMAALRMEEHWGTDMANIAIDGYAAGAGCVLHTAREPIEHMADLHQETPRLLASIRHIEKEILAA